MRSIKFIKFILIGICSVVLLGGCNHQSNKTPKALINPEILGSWSDSAGCSLELASKNNHLLAVSFKSAQHGDYMNISLLVRKDGVFTRFEVESAGVKFSGIFADGVIMIDNKLCQQALHKDANK